MRVIKLLAVAGILSCVVTCGVLGCGGGTTGTSPTESLRFSGFAEQSDQTRAPSLAMAVRSSETDEVLVNSGTDQRGEFDMTLPADEESFVVTIDQVGSAVVSRSTKGEAVATAKLVVTRENTLVAEHFSEAQVDSATLCSALVVSSDRLIRQGEIPEASCLVTIRVVARDRAVEGFVGSVSGVCDGRQEELARANLSRAGVVTFDLQQPLTRGCSNVQIEIADPANSDLAQVFTVE